MAYKAFDRVVASFRFKAALPYIRTQARVCDIGCGLDARFLKWARSRISFGVGLDRQIAQRNQEGVPILLSDITRGLPVCSDYFDHAVMLAVLEHLREPFQVLREAFRILAPGGSLVMTWPHAAVDPILKVLHRIGLISDEMESQAHVARIPLDQLLAMLRKIGFERFIHRRFELGLNNLLVAHKPR